MSGARIFRIFIYGSVLTCFYISLLPPYSNAQDDENFEVTYNKKDKAAKRPPRPRPPPPPPPAPPAASPKFVVEPKKEPVPGDPCHPFSTDPCKCSNTNGCQFEELSAKCVTYNNPDMNSLTCQRANAHYAYNSKILCQNNADSGDCASGTAVYAVNLQGPDYIDSKNIMFKEEDPTRKLDPDKFTGKGSVSCKVNGVSDADGTELYAKFAEGDLTKVDESSCVSYLIPLIQDGQYELTIKTLSGEGVRINTCFHVKIGGVSVTGLVNLMNVTNKQNCKAVDITFLFIVKNSIQQLLVKGHSNAIPIQGGFSLKFCNQPCTLRPSVVFRASAYSLFRFGPDSKPIKDIDLSVKTLPDGTQIFDTSKVKVKTVKNETIQSVQSQAENQQKTEEELDRAMKQQQDKNKRLDTHCPNVTEQIDCKLDGCEWSLEAKKCVSGKQACSQETLGLNDCFRDHSYYVSAGIMCPTGDNSTGTCETKEVKFAVNIRGTDTEDQRGITYTSWKSQKNPDHDYIDIRNDTRKLCRSRTTNQIEIGGIVAGDSGIYETFVRSKGTSSACLDFPIKNCDSGIYELCIKLMDPYYDDKGRRAFDIKINESPVVENLDIASYVTGCDGLDLVMHLRVDDDGILLPGFNDEIILKDKTITVSFCPGSVDKSKYNESGFIVSAAYLAKFKSTNEPPPSPPQGPEPPPPPKPDLNETKIDCKECENLNGDPKGCKEVGLEYNIVDLKCIRRKPNCNSSFVGKFSHYCRRPNVRYVSGGVLCYSAINKVEPMCESLMTIHAVNHGSDKPLRNRRGINYKPEGKWVVDESTRAVDNKDQCSAVTVDDPAEQELYKTFIYGTGKDNFCITYDIPLCQDGDYELVLKLADHLAEANQRCFDVRLEDKPILIGVDIARHSGNKSCTGVDIAFPIRVVSYGGHTNMKSVQVMGHISELFVDKKMQLKYCSCEWESPNPIPKASAFSFVRFGGGGITCDICSLQDENEDKCTNLGCKYLKEKKKCLMNPAKGDVCVEQKNNTNACRKEGCQYNVVTGECVEGGKECDDATFSNYNKCSRQGAHYSNGGVLCKSTKDSGTCGNGNSTTWALDLGGKEYKSPRGITYDPEEPRHSLDPMAIKTASASNRFCNDTDAEFLQLWGTSVQSDAKKTGCLTYAMPVCQDGKYELSLLMVDGFHRETNKRCFDIKLNNVIVSSSVDLNRMGGKPCARNELIYLFNLNNSASQLSILGHKKPYPVEANVYLSICTGTCGYADPAFVASAFSLTRLNEGTIDCDKCSIYNKNPIECEKDDCEYNAATQTCIAAVTETLKCRKLSDDPCGCAEQKCRYNTDTKKCTVGYQGFEGKVACRRQNTKYVFSPKLICRNAKSNGLCTDAVTVYGVNMNGPDFVDSKGLKYKREEPSMVVDPRDIRVTGKNDAGDCEIEGVPERAMKHLWGTFISGNLKKVQVGACLGYPVPILQDGQYELIVKATAQSWTEEMKRCFTIQINDVQVAVNVDVMDNGGKTSCGSIDIAFLFLVEEGQKMMRVKGNPTAIPISNGFHVQFCFGSCKDSKADNRFFISAFTVVRFGEDSLIPNEMKGIRDNLSEDDLICDPHSTDKCKCILNDCRFDTFTGFCVGQHENWKFSRKCKRLGLNYAVGSEVMCKVASKAGDCTASTTTFGVNMGGLAYNDSTGVRYREDKPGLLIDPKQIKEPNPPKTCSAVENAAANDASLLYGTFIIATRTPKNLIVQKPSDKCVAYQVPILQDGEYELLIKALETVYTELGRRRFDIRINDVPIVINVGLVKIGGGKNCVAIDIVQTLLVSSFGTMLRIRGHPQPIPISKGFALQFCYGNKNGTDWAFQVSAFSLSRFGANTTVVPEEAEDLWYPPPRRIKPEPPCGDHKDEKKCREAGCEYDLFGKQCVFKMKEPPKEIFETYGNCRRKDAMYGEGGILWKNNQEGNCTGTGTVYALNLNGNDFKYKSRDIKYKAELPSSYLDTPPIRTPLKMDNQCPDDKDDFFLKLIATAIHADQKAKEGCLTYPIPLAGDGSYELSIWVMDPQDQRCFDINLGSKTVLSAVNPSRISGKKCGRNEFIVLFKVHNSVKQLAPLGFHAENITEGKAELQFCLHSSGQCTGSDISFIASAFSLVKILGDMSSIADSCDEYGTAKDCKENGCEYNLQTFQCMPEVKDCQEAMFTDSIKCRREDALYAHAGVLCKNKDCTKAKCEKGKIIYAINLGGEDYTHRNVKYQAEKPSMYNDPAVLRQTVNHAKSCPEKKSEVFQKLIGPAIVGKGKGKDCITYPVPVSGAGRYELSIVVTDTAETVRQRCFDIFIGSLKVLYLIDPISLCGEKCCTSELVILFSVKKGATQLVVKGFPTPVPIADGKFELKFCMGSCSYPDTGFVVSAFSLIKFRKPCPTPVVECKNHKTSRSCKEGGCEYDLVNKKCMSKVMECSEDAIPTENNECRRAGALYGKGGVLCKNTAESGNCQAMSTTYALNLNGEDYQHPTRKIVYKTDNPGYQWLLPYQDLAKLRLPFNSASLCKDDKDEEFIKLLAPSIYGNKEKAQQGCVIYPFPVEQDGDYELSIWSVDHRSGVKERCFDIMLESVTVLSTLDPFRLSGKMCGRNEFIIVFRVEKSRTQLIPLGFPPIEITGGRAELKFCMGNCTYTDWSFQVSAFSVLKFDGGECDGPGNDEAACKQSDCQYDLVNQKCSTKLKDCTADIFKEYAGCRREGGFYGNAGVLCKNMVASQCQTAQKVYAINMNGQDYLLPSRNIKFDAETPASFNDPSALRKVSIWNRVFCKDLRDPDFMNLFSTSVYGVMKAGNKDTCVTHPVPLKGDGFYELTVWSLDGGHKKPNERCFNIMLNGITVLTYLDPTSLGGRHCARVELIILFRVDSSGTQVFPLGFPNPIQVTGGKLDLKLCMGGCDRVDYSFHVSAFSLMKLTGSKLNDTVIPPKPVKPPQSEDEKCLAINNDGCECKFRGCEYDLIQKKCLQVMKDCQPESMRPYGECQRMGAFYSDAGVLCKSTQSNSARCKQGKPVYALNLNGRNFTHPNRNITYLEETIASYKDPKGLVAIANAFQDECARILNDTIEQHLFGPLVFGLLGTSRTGCVTYPFPITEDGNYELSILIVDNHMQAKKRCFDIKLNSKTVLDCVDPLSLTRFCNTLELIVLFKVRNSGTQLIPQGFRDPIIIADGKVELGACMGTCSQYPDLAFQLSAFSIVKMINSQ